MEFAWYETILNSHDLQQGDFIIDCPIIIPPANIKLEQVDVEVKLMDTIVLSQSCDLENEKLDIVLVCPYYRLSEYLEQVGLSIKEKSKFVENLRKGFIAANHLLNKNDDIEGFDDYMVVDFRNVYGIHISALKEIIIKKETRVRLLPPYREHLSQAFARYFMRVGLPQDIIVEGY